MNQALHLPLPQFLVCKMGVIITILMTMMILSSRVANSTNVSFVAA